MKAKYIKPSYVVYKTGRQPLLCGSNDLFGDPTIIPRDNEED